MRVPPRFKGLKMADGTVRQTQMKCSLSGFGEPRWRRRRGGGGGKTKKKKKKKKKKKGGRMLFFLPHEQTGRWSPDWISTVHLMPSNPVPPTNSTTSLSLQQSLLRLPLFSLKSPPSSSPTPISTSPLSGTASSTNPTSASTTSTFTPIPLSTSPLPAASSLTTTSSSPNAPTALLDDPANALFSLMSQHCIPLHSLIASTTFDHSSSSSSSSTTSSGIRLKYKSFIEIISRDKRL